MKHIIIAMALAAGMCLAGCKGRTAQENDGDGASVTTETKAEEVSFVGEAPTREPLYLELAQDFKVNGKPGIQSFVEALPVYNKEYGWYNDPEFDTRNGFFHYGEEGDGGVYYYGCIWKRDDGKRLFILSYRESSWNEYKGCKERFTRHGGSPWYYASTELWMCGENMDQISYLDEDTGFAAYLFNEDTNTLELLSEPPFNGWQAKNVHRFLILPQKGKDIEVEEGVFEETVTSTLKWNGMTFDY